MMNSEYTQFEKGFWVRWVLASASGLFVGFVIYFFSVDGIASEQGFILKTLISTVAGAIFGAVIGGVQLFVLRQKVSGMNHWLAANIIGAAIGGTLALPVSEAVGDATNFNIAILAGGVVLGLAFGIGQAVVLRPYLSEGGWWALAHAVGIPFGYALGRGLGEVVFNLLVGGAGEDIARVIGVLIFAVLFFGGYGMITGGVLIRLLKQPGPVAPA
jgi:hypothetical protein